MRANGGANGLVLNASVSYHCNPLCRGGETMASTASQSSSRECIDEENQHDRMAPSFEMVTENWAPTLKINYIPPETSLNYVSSIYLTLDWKGDVVGK